MRTVVPARDKPANLDGPIPWLRIEDFNGKYVGESASGQGVTSQTVQRMNLKVFPAGTVICTCSCSMGTTAIADRPLITNQTFIGLVPRGDALVSEYLYWALQGFKTELDAQATGAIQQYLSRDDFRQLRLPIPPVDQQRLIAAFLDAETARIDALIAKKRRLVELLDSRHWAVLSKDVASSTRVPLRRALVTMNDGPFGSAFSSADYSEEGVAVVRLGNIGFAEWRGSDLAHIPYDRFDEFMRHRVREGDLLMAGLGDANNHAGRACVAPDLGPAIVKGKCFCGRIDRSRAVPEFLAMVLSSPDGAQAISVEARGSTRSMINLDIMKAVQVPLPAVEVQQQIVRRVGEVWAKAAKVRQRLDRQMSLLAEHRQALITAAVTGELAVPGVAA